MLTSSHRIYTLPTDARAQKLRSIAVLHEDADAAREIARFRVIKSPAEIALITQATDATVAAHLAAWRQDQAGPVRISRSPPP